VYGGTIMPGMLDGKELTVVDVYEAVGAYDAGQLSLEGLKNIENTACPNAGSCGGMFTANTMASISEAIGLALPGSASPPAEDDRRGEIVYDTGVACAKLLEMNIRPKEILSFEAFENAIIMLNSVGGSTNGILHLLALANEVNIDLNYDDFERIRKKTPHLADMKPGGNYVMNSLDKIGGIPFVLKKLLDKGLLNENCITVTGKTIKENLVSMNIPEPEQNIVRSIENPLHSVGTAVILKGSLAPDGAVIKTAGVEMTKFTGKACSKLLELNVKPLDILTFEAFENAITMLNAVGGSTNGILHLLALANEAKIKLTYDDFERVRKKTPHLADMKPGGNYVMNSLDKIGGIPFVLKKLDDKGLIHGNCLTVTGKQYTKI
jgi:dihydroxyacid dehydratase/phosphogluconate dehydratase